MSRIAFVAVAVLALFATSAVAEYKFDVDFVANANVSINGQSVLGVQLDAGGLQIRTKPLLGGLFAKSGQGYISATTGLNLSLIPLRLGLDYEVDIANLAAGGPYALNAHWNASILQVTPGFDFSAAAAANLIASFPYAIVEVDSEGVDVAVHMIKDFTWDVLSTFKAAASASARIGAQAYTCKKTHNGGEFTVDVTLQTAVVAGTSNWLRYNLLPRSWVHAINITNYVFATAGNSLRVVQAVATGSANIKLNTAGQLTFPCPTATSDSLLQAYADLNATVVLGNGTTATADVSAWAKANVNSILDSFPALKAQLAAKFDADVSIYLANVTHPANQGNCTCTGRSATGNRLAEAQQAPIAPQAPTSAPTPVTTNPDGSIVPEEPSPSAASAVPVSFAVVIAFLAVLGLFF